MKICDKFICSIMVNCVIKLVVDCWCVYVVRCNVKISKVIN